MGIPEEGSFLGATRKRGKSVLDRGLFCSGLPALEKNRDARGRFAKERKTTFSLRAISMRAKQFVVMEGMDERSL